MYYCIIDNDHARVLARCTGTVCTGEEVAYTLSEGGPEVRGTVTATMYVLDETQDDAVLVRTLYGTDELATVKARYFRSEI